MEKIDKLDVQEFDKSTPNYSRAEGLQKIGCVQLICLVFHKTFHHVEGEPVVVEDKRFANVRQLFEAPRLGKCLGPDIGHDVLLRNRCHAALHGTIVIAHFY